jgi:hypothetical protein
MDPERLVLRSTYSIPLWLELWPLVLLGALAFVIRGGLPIKVFTATVLLSGATINFILHRYVYFTKVEIEGNDVSFWKENGSHKEKRLSDLVSISRVRGGFIACFRFEDELLKGYIYVDRRVASEIEWRRSQYVQGGKMEYYHRMTDEG